jgi:hypothetical protein
MRRRRRRWCRCRMMVWKRLETDASQLEAKKNHQNYSPNWLREGITVLCLLFGCYLRLCRCLKRSLEVVNCLLLAWSIFISVSWNFSAFVNNSHWASSPSSISIISSRVENFSIWSWAFPYLRAAHWLELSQCCYIISVSILHSIPLPQTAGALPPV